MMRAVFGLALVAAAYLAPSQFVLAEAVPARQPAPTIHTASAFTLHGTPNFMLAPR